MVQFTCLSLNGNGTLLDNTRSMLNDILYRSNITSRINPDIDTQLQSEYAVAHIGERVIGAARLCLKPSIEDVVNSGIIEGIRSCYPEFVFYPQNEIINLICRNSGLAVLPEFRKGVTSIHIGNELHRLREEMAIYHKKSFILMLSRRTAFNLAERNCFKRLGDETFTAELQTIEGRWYMKKVVYTTLESISVHTTLGEGENITNDFINGN